jgi:hypothetical protein
MAQKAILIDEKDNVATVTNQIGSEKTVAVLNPEGIVVLEIQINEDLRFGHKIAVKNLDAGVNIVKYGEVIGVSSQPIKTGQWVHTHNVKSARLDTSGQ